MPTKSQQSSTSGNFADTPQVDKSEASLPAPSNPAPTPPAPPGSPEPEQLPTSAAGVTQPPAAYLPTGEASPTPAPAGEPGEMPPDGQGTPYPEGKLEEISKKPPGGQDVAGATPPKE